jgi:RNA methyltransferase, TrmH family
MLSKAKIKLIQSLGLKKQRSELKLFVVEGKKQVAELLTTDFVTECIAGTQQWLDAHAPLIKKETEVIVVTDAELQKASLLQAPQQVLAIVRIPGTTFNKDQIRHAFTIVLDGIQDPGNLGTIVRIADWYGIPNIVCSPDCVDLYNPKTIQATMGSFLRVNVWYENLAEVLHDTGLPVYGALMEGTSLHQTRLNETGILLVGNEGKGISPALLPFISHPVTIPRFGGAESLNAGIATAIICDGRARNSPQ